MAKSAKKRLVRQWVKATPGGVPKDEGRPQRKLKRRPERAIGASASRSLTRQKRRSTINGMPEKERRKTGRKDSQESESDLSKGSMPEGMRVRLRSPDLLAAMRQRMEEAVTASGYSYEQVGIRMGVDPERNPSNSAWKLVHESPDPGVIMVRRFCEATGADPGRILCLDLPALR